MKNEDDKWNMLGCGKPAKPSVASMSPRLWLAGQAIAGLSANADFILRLLDEHKHEDKSEIIASVALSIADATLAANKSNL